MYVCMYVCMYVYIYIYKIQYSMINTVLSGGDLPKCKLHSSRCFFRWGLENVSLHFQGILKTLHTKTRPGGRSATNFTLKGGGGAKNVSYILAWSPPEK